MKDKKDKVIFRVATYDRYDCREMGDQEVLAFFPDAPSNKGNILCYAHIGQHCEASIGFYKYHTKRPSKKWSEKVDDLKTELISIGYDIEKGE